MKAPKNFYNAVDQKKLGIGESSSKIRAKHIGNSSEIRPEYLPDFVSVILDPDNGFNYVVKVGIDDLPNPTIRTQGEWKSASYRLDASIDLGYSNIYFGNDDKIHDGSTNGRTIVVRFDATMSNDEYTAYIAEHPLFIYCHRNDVVEDNKRYYAFQVIDSSKGSSGVSNYVTPKIDIIQNGYINFTQNYYIDNGVKHSIDTGFSVDEFFNTYNPESTQMFYNGTGKVTIEYDPAVLYFMGKIGILNKIIGNGVI